MLQLIFFDRYDDMLPELPVRLGLGIAFFTVFSYIVSTGIHLHHPKNGQLTQWEGPQVSYFAVSKLRSKGHPLGGRKIRYLRLVPHCK